MNYLSVEKLTKSYGERILFEDISFGLSKGDKIALIANNGTGKSSMLKIIAGNDVSDSGKVITRDGIRIGYLEQIPVLDETKSINQLIKIVNTQYLKATTEYEKALKRSETDSSKEAQKILDLASSNMDHLDAWNYERKLAETLSLFNIIDLDQKIDILSGGQKKRLALAIVLLDNPDIIILDEPTNHLDIEMIEWLEKYLEKKSITLLMVTHDRYFLDRICNQIIELSNGNLYNHKGNYAYFLEKRAEREEILETEIDKAKKLMKRELDWVRRMPQARGTKSKSRIDAFYKTKDKAQSGIKKQDINFDIKMSRLGGKILECKNLSKSYKEIKIIENFNYTFNRGERIGIIGKNGSGKTSFLKLLMEEEKADKGIIDTGETIIYGYYKQIGIQFKDDQRVIDIIKEIAEVIQLANGKTLSASQFLQYFMFSPDMQYTLVSNLSGGEKRRLYLLTVLIKNPNFLILDEPTNDLDLLTLSRLEEFLLNFSGCLILVSHDRYFLDKLVDHLFIFEGEAKITDYYGSYSQYKVKKIEEIKNEKKQKSLFKKPPQKVEKKPDKKKLTYKEKLEYAELENGISELEDEKKELEIILSNSEKLEYNQIEEISKKLGIIINEIDKKTDSWLELSEFI